MTAPTKHLRDQIREMLLDHRGSDNPISSREISDELGIDEVESFPVTRGLIKEILKEDKIPVAGYSQGYFVIETEEELEDYLDNLDSRAMNTIQRKYLIKNAASDHGFITHDSDDTENMGISDFL
ncbi:hypothetical protein [Natronocalculus amylovorans]|uniref:Uncharacterized protein n=1 Tax=Natronocalculus amylovorans TaxID=2917812 RepID=A0AAE3FZS4_9EURY|nr:hypothetical protein [Natronocalculus amylovorans]MCL9818392.1 hypothetical protein [Natronocalculus amylovorans]